MSASDTDLCGVIDALPPLRSVIAAHDLRAERKLGQNFLLDLNITDKIARLAYDSLGDPTKAHMLEIGPGPGGLTRSLLKYNPHQVSAVEFDPRALAALQELRHAAEGKLELIEGDALEVDLLAISQAPRAIVANLPYNIATPLLLRWLGELREDSAAYQSLTLMFQKEVAQRVVAGPNSKAYGRLAVMAQWLCDVRIVYDLPPSAFTPPPKVTSAVVQFVPKNLSGDQPGFAAMESITAAAFGQRRKMLRQSLKAFVPCLETLGIDPTRRAEDLRVAEYIALALEAEKAGLL